MNKGVISDTDCVGKRRSLIECGASGCIDNNVRPLNGIYSCGPLCLSTVTYSCIMEDNMNYS